MLLCVNNPQIHILNARSKYPNKPSCRQMTKTPKILKYKTQEHILLTARATRTELSF